MDDFKSAIQAAVASAVSARDVVALDELARELGRLQAQVQKARQLLVEKSAEPGTPTP